jgi:hypothetical protein
MPDTELSSEPARPRTPLLRNWLSLAGLVIAVGSLFSFLLLLDAAAHLANPYLGILTYLVAPGFLITCSFLIILRALWQRHRLKAAASLPGQPINGQPPAGWTRLRTAFSMCGSPICPGRAARKVQ